MVIDAIVLAGGRSTRLGEVPKAGLRFEQQTLLERAVDAVSFARRIVVVGEVAGSRIRSTVLLTREDPPFGGPAAAIAAGLASLHAAAPDGPSRYTMVLACDIPRAAAAMAALRDAVGLGALADGTRLDGTAVKSTATDGFIAVDADQRKQPLAAVYATARLMDAVTACQRRGDLSGLSAFRLIDGMALTPLIAPTGSTDDVDTWDDAARFGIERLESRENRARAW